MTEALLAQEATTTGGNKEQTVQRLKPGKSRHLEMGKRKALLVVVEGREVKGDGVIKQRIKQNSIKEKRKNTGQ